MAYGARLGLVLALAFRHDRPDRAEVVEERRVVLVHAHGAVVATAGAGPLVGRGVRDLGRRSREGVVHEIQRELVLEGVERHLASFVRVPEERICVGVEVFSDRQRQGGGGGGQQQ